MSVAAFLAAGALAAADELPKTETILDKYIEATGGKAAYAKIHSEISTGTMEFAAMGLKGHEPTLEYLLDLVTDVQTVRTCQTAAELDPERSMDGSCIPRRIHVAAGSIAMLKARQRMAETLRILPGSSLVVAPSDSDLASREVAA